MPNHWITLATLATLAGLALPAAAIAADDNAEPSSQDLARAEPIGALTADFLLRDQMPTGLTATTDGRRFASCRAGVITPPIRSPGWFAMKNRPIRRKRALDWTPQHQPNTWSACSAW